MGNITFTLHQLVIIQCNNNNNTYKKKNNNNKNNSNIIINQINYFKKDGTWQLKQSSGGKKGVPIYFTSIGFSSFVNLFVQVFIFFACYFNL